MSNGLFLKLLHCKRSRSIVAPFFFCKRKTVFHFYRPKMSSEARTAQTDANNAKNKRDSQGNMIGDKSATAAATAPGIEKDQQFEKSQEHKRLSGKHGHTGLGFKPEEEETQQEAAVTSGGVKKATDNNNTGNLDDEDEDEEEEEEEEDEDDEDKSLDDEDEEEDDLSDEEDEDDDVNEDISDEEEDDGEVPTDAKKMKLIEEESH